MFAKLYIVYRKMAGRDDLWFIPVSKAMLPEIEEALKKHFKASIVWQYMGEVKDVER